LMFPTPLRYLPKQLTVQISKTFSSFFDVSNSFTLSTKTANRADFYVIYQNS